MNTFILSKKSFIDDAFILFLLAFIVRLIFILFQNPSVNELIEDELLYWNNAVNYVNEGFLDDSILTERMFGIFVYIKMLLVLSFQNLKIYLAIQSMIDAFNCLIIYKTADILFPKQKVYIYLSALFSPLMIILSLQVLSETIFLFFFTIFIYFSATIISGKEKLYLKIIMAGLFLGLSTSIRSITYPLIFLSILPLIIILIKKEILKYKIFISCVIVLAAALLPISSRVYQNMQSYNSFALTTQAGTHLAYWITPSILTQVENISRSEAINVINEVANKYTISNNYFEKDKILRKVGFEVLSQINAFDIALHWTKSGLINLLAPSILIDKTFRTLPHPSYYETGNILIWLKLIINNSNIIIIFLFCVYSISSIFTIFSLILDLFIFIKLIKLYFI